MNLQKLEELRKRKGLLQRDFAESFGFTATGYQKMLRTNEIKLSVFEKICQTYNVSPLIFFDTNVTSAVAEPSESYAKKNNIQDEKNFYKELYEKTQKQVEALQEAIMLMSEKKKNKVQN